MKHSKTKTASLAQFLYTWWQFRLIVFVMHRKPTSAYFWSLFPSIGISACSGSIEVWASLICGFLVGLISSVILWLVQKWPLSWISSSSQDITYINGIPGIIGAVTGNHGLKSLVYFYFVVLAQLGVVLSNQVEDENVYKFLLAVVVRLLQSNLDFPDVLIIKTVLPSLVFFLNIDN